MAHRRTDVDVDDEDAFVDDDQAAGPALHELEAALAAKTAGVRSALSRGGIAAALQLALDQPPTGGRDVEPLKERATQLVVEALAAARPSDIAAIVGQLPPQLVDTLMKYLYRAMASPDVFSSALLLSWHEKVYEVGGVGSVVRVLTDRRSV